MSLKTATLGITLLLAVMVPNVMLANDNATRQIRDRMAVIKVEFTIVRSGPADAYTSKGRLYRNDRVTVRGEPGAEWVEVITGDIKGWVTLNTLRIIPFESVRKTETGTVDQGRDRRETNYRYDGRGRRLSADGQPMGSGEGTEAPVEKMVAETGIPTDITLSLGVGVALIDRQFFTNSNMDSLLYAVMASPLGLASRLSASWRGTPWWHLKFDLSDSRLGSTRFAEPALNDGSPVEIEADHQTLFLGSRFTYEFGVFSLGAELGIDMFRIGFQQTRPVPILLSTQSWHGAAGVIVGMTSDTLEGVVIVKTMLPLSIEQQPVTSGEPTGSAYGLSSQVRWWFSDPWGAQLDVSYTRMRVEYSGANDHVDNVSDGGPFSYDLAIETNERWTLTGGLSYRL